MLVVKTAFMTIRCIELCPICRVFVLFMFDREHLNNDLSDQEHFLFLRLMKSDMFATQINVEPSPSVN
jgi:hypothetical protein